MKDVFLLHILYFLSCTMTVGLELGSQMSKFHSFFTYCIRICVSYVQYPENILWKLQHWFTGIPFNVDKIRWSELQETSKGFPQHPVPILSVLSRRMLWYIYYACNFSLKYHQIPLVVSVFYSWLTITVYGTYLCLYNDFVPVMFTGTWRVLMEGTCSWPVSVILHWNPENFLCCWVFWNLVV